MLTGGVCAPAAAAAAATHGRIQAARQHTGSCGYRNTSRNTVLLLLLLKSLPQLLLAQSLLQDAVLARWCLQQSDATSLAHPKDAVSATRPTSTSCL
jgi:hypothetical protein